VPYGLRMLFRELDGGVSVRRPSVDDDDLDDLDEPLAGDFEWKLVRLTGDSTDATGAGELTRSLASGTNLSGSRYERLNLSDVSLRRADLSTAVWERVNARRVEVTDCRTVGWRAAFDVAEDMYVGGCRLDLGAVTFERTKGTVVFDNCTFRETAIRGRLDRVVFHDCDLAGADLRVTSAKGCDLRTSRLDGAQGLLSLRGARITTTQAVAIADLLAAEVGFEVTNE
jgi:uncharacterized protein YjbI with pentapeptide repeats